MATTDDDDNDNAPMTEAEAIKHFATMQQAADDRAFFTDGELASVTTALERLGLDHDRSAGLKEVQDCRKTGFHPDHQRNGQNAGNGVYEEAEHVQWTQGPLQVVDLRKR